MLQDLFLMSFQQPLNVKTTFKDIEPRLPLLFPFFEHPCIEIVRVYLQAVLLFRGELNDTECGNLKLTPWPGKK